MSQRTRVSDRPARLASGMYRVLLNVDGHEYSQGLRVEVDAALSSGLIAEEEDDEDKPVVIDD